MKQTCYCTTTKLTTLGSTLVTNGLQDTMTFGSQCVNLCSASTQDAPLDMNDCLVHISGCAVHAHFSVDTDLCLSWGTPYQKVFSSS